MKINTTKEMNSCDTIVLPLLNVKKITCKVFKALDSKLECALSSVLSDEVYESGKITEVYTNGKLKAKKVVLLGLGEKKKLDIDSLRAAAGTLAKSVKGSVVVHKSFEKGGVQAFTEGLVLGAYDFNEFKSEKKDGLGSVSFLANTAAEKKKLEREINSGFIVGSATNYARDLVNRPANIVTPAYMAKEAQKIAKMPKVSCKVLGKAELEKEKMNLHLAVSEGSPQEPKIVVLHYKNSTKKPTVLVGKGVTFDSGGTCLKPYLGMIDMKGDMAGSAVVLATLKALAEMKAAVNVYAVMPLTENIIGGKAQKVGDVVVAASGTTVEIEHTDAEGRLILADALNYSLRYKPVEMIDVATLTGATIMALGTKVASIMGNDDKLVSKLIDSGSRAGEKMWQLPQWDLYEEDIKSSIADIKNLGKPKSEASTITAGLFLKHFVANVKWAHLDIGGTFLWFGDKGYQKKGPSGFGVRTLITHIAGKRR